MDEDLEAMTREQLIVEARRLRAGIRAHRDSSGHALCWHHPALWGLLPEKSDPVPTVPTWPEFLRGCLQYRESLDKQLPDAPRSAAPYLRPAIARIWRGRTTAARADDYARYLHEHGIKPLEKKALGVQMLREDRAGESEFVTISYWESVEAMSRFAGADPRRIHHLERDAEFLIELPSGVQVLNIIVASGPTGGDES